MVQTGVGRLLKVHFRVQQGDVLVVAGVDLCVGEVLQSERVRPEVVLQESVSGRLLLPERAQGHHGPWTGKEQLEVIEVQDGKLVGVGHDNMAVRCSRGRAVGWVQGQVLH